MVIAASGWMAACRHHTHTAALADAANADSLAGVVSVTGTGFDQRLVLRVGTSTTALVATSADSASLTRVGGAEVVVFGQTVENAFHVASFAVRSVDGAPVADGTLQRASGRLVLRVPLGELALGNPPAALDSLVGARVWIGGPLATGPNVYGIISPAP